MMVDPLIQAREFLAKKQWDKAVSFCHQVLRKQPDLSHIYPLLAKSLAGIGKLAESISNYNRAIALLPEQTQLYGELAEVYEQQGELEQARAYYERALKLEPTKPEYHFHLGIILHKLGDWNAAADSYSQAVAFRANYPQAYFNLGVLYDNQGQLDLAISNYRKAISYQTDYISAYSNLGGALARKEKLPEAIQVYQQALKLNPVWETLHNNLGQIFWAQEKLDLALLSFRRAIISDPEMALAHHNLGKLWLQQGNYEAAIESFLRVAILEPNNIVAHSECASSLMHQGRLAQAMEHLKEAIRFQPAFVNAYCRQAAHLSSNDLLDCAKISCANFLQALKQNKDLPELYEHLWHTYYYLGNVLFEYGAFFQAGQYYQKALQVKNESADVYYRLGICLSKQHRFDSAIAMYQMGLIFAPLQGEILFALGKVLEKKHHFDSATNYYEKVLYLQQTQESSFSPSLLVNNNSEIQQPPQGVYLTTEDWIEDCLKNPQWQAKYVHVLSTKKIKSKPFKKKSSETIVAPALATNPPNCGGVTCRLCMKKLIDTYRPIQVAKKGYLCSWDDAPFIEPPANFVVRIPDGRAYIAPQKSSWMICNQIGIITPDNYLLGDLSRYYPWYLPGCQNYSLATHPLFDAEELPIVEKIDGKVAILSTLSGHVYYHWTIDLLPRIDILRRSGMDLAEIDWFVVNNTKYEFQRESLEILGIPPEKILHSDSHPHIQAKELIVPSFPGHLDWVSEETVDFLRQTFLTHNSSLNKDYPERIYVSRANAKYRQVLNEKKVVELLTELGFITVFLEKMSLVEQANLFACAKAIVSPHGAGLTNLVFCEKGTKIVELFSPNYLRTDYWMVSEYRQLEHYYIVGQTFNCYPLQELMYQNSLTEDILVNLNSLKLVLSEAGLDR